MILKKWFYKIVINYMFNVTSRGQTFISADVNTPPNSPSKVHFIPLCYQDFQKQSFWT